MDSIPSTIPSNPDHPDDCSSDGGHSSQAVVRVRGLPFNTTVEQVASLLHDVALADDTSPIVLARLPDGRPTGDAYVHVASEEALSTALGHDNHKLGTRYVQVFRASMRDMHEASGGSSVTSTSTLTRSSSSSGDVATTLPLSSTPNSSTPIKPGSRTPTRGQGRGSPGGSGRGGRGAISAADAPQMGPVVELRGLPFMATVDDIVSFFQGRHMHSPLGHPSTPPQHTGFDVTAANVTLPMRRDPRTGMLANTGYAHVVFPNREVAARARQARHCKMMGNRYIECLPPSHHMVLPRPRPEEWAGPHSWPSPVCGARFECRVAQRTCTVHDDGQWEPSHAGDAAYAASTFPVCLFACFFRPVLQQHHGIERASFPSQGPPVHDMTPEQHAAMVNHGAYSQPMYFVPQPGSPAPMAWPPASGPMHGGFAPGEGQGPWMPPSHPGSPYAMPYMMGVHHYMGRPSPPRPAEGPPGPAPPEGPPPSPKVAGGAVPAPPTPQLQRAGPPSEEGGLPRVRTGAPRATAEDAD